MTGSESDGFDDLEQLDHIDIDRMGVTWKEI